VATLVVPIGIGAVFISTTATEVLRQASATNGQETDAGHMTQTELLIQSIQPTVAFTVLCLITIRNASADHNESFCPEDGITGALLERHFVSLEPSR